MDCICIDINFSTTRMVLDKKPVIQNSNDNCFQSCLFLESSKSYLSDGGLRTKGCFKETMVQKPLVTIVTVVFNGEFFLEDTIKSVIYQSYDNVEYIIVDGGSTDGTLDIIRKYEHAIDYWVSEEDQGIYDAMNKGIQLASGDWINFMNAGDRFFDSNVLDSINFDSKSSKYILAGDVEYDSGKVFLALSGSMYMKNTIHHQGAFYPSLVFKKLGLYSTKFMILADYDFNLKCLQHNFFPEKLNGRIAVCSDYGVSDVPKLTNYQEEIHIRCQYLNSSYKCFIFGCYSLVRFVVKRIIRWI